MKIRVVAGNFDGEVDVKYIRWIYYIQKTGKYGVTFIDEEPVEHIFDAVMKDKGEIDLIIDKNPKIVSNEVKENWKGIKAMQTWLND